MGTKLNIAEILKDKPQGTKLYDLLCNMSVKLNTISTTETIVWCSNKTDNKTTRLCCYSEFGTVRGCPDGLQILKPSKSMQDWSKFAWKKGDILISNDGKREVLFKTWENDNYTKFVGFHCLITSSDEEVEYDNGTTIFNTDDFIGIEAEGAAKTYINTIEERLGGKLNLETLEIEKAHPELKDGDIVTQGVLEGVNIYIIKNCMDKIDNKYNYYARYDTQYKEIKYDDWAHISPFAKFSTNSEKQQLFDALAKENKAWDTEKKEVIDLKPKVKFKPFDKVVAYGEILDEWSCDIFSHYAKNCEGKEVIICIGGGAYCKALPFNEETAKLLGTKNNVEG